MNVLARLIAAPLLAFARAYRRAAEAREANFRNPTDRSTR